MLLLLTLLRLLSSRERHLRPELTPAITALAAALAAASISWSACEGGPRDGGGAAG